jgi:hypothetical protein
MAKSRGLEIELEESREEQSRAEEEIMQLKRELDELRAERDGAGGGASTRGDDIDPSMFDAGSFTPKKTLRRSKRKSTRCSPSCARSARGEWRRRTNWRN